MGMIQLRGMTWNHPRGVLPLQAAAAKFQQLNPEVEITWDARSLHDFEAYPLDLLAEKYDLMMVDHPHLGTAVKLGVLVPLNEHVSAAFLDDQRANSVGKSHESYEFDGRQWAFAADAAAQVSAFRPDLLQQHGLQAPRTWAEVTQLIQQLPGGVKVGLPLAPVHAFASFVTLSAQLTDGQLWNNDQDLSPELGAEVLALLQSFLPKLHPSSLSSDPITMSDLMAATDEIAYIPLIYGYSNYAREGFASRTIHYTDIPSDNGVPSGSMIGGVGIAVSSKSRYIPQCVAFAQLVADGEFQRTEYTVSGGQPGHRSAWTDAETNRLTNNFFAGTLRTLDHGYLRPRFDGYIEFQEQAGKLIQQHLASGDHRHAELVRKLNELRRK
ncbi:ABC transporter substrate-binding protein [Paenibacillus sp. y28]|uniref:ABC transporter substrate-binding protein n=1 Tax=Paenibacillus sp. y28 TaxID=3129110 RepID=UPI003019A688